MDGERTVEKLLESKPGIKKEFLDEGGWMLLNWTWGVWLWKDGEQELWAEQNGYLSWGNPRSNLKGCSAKEERNIPKPIRTRIKTI